jgi:FMN phosphatase YigB (HAD superfamily)
LGISSGYFDSVTYTQEAGANKPDPTIFQLALKRAGCSPNEAVHVGDSYEKDVLGARRIGIMPILSTGMTITLKRIAYASETYVRSTLARCG